MTDNMGRGILAPKSGSHIQDGATEMRTLGRTTAAAINDLDRKASTRLGHLENVTDTHSREVTTWAQETAQNRLDLERIEQEGVKGAKGDPGERGLPGVNAVENDTAVAAYLEATDSLTRQVADSLFVRSVATTEFWVHPQGSDTEGDGTEQNPFATINHAIGLAERVALDRSASINIRLFPTTYTETVRFAQNTGTNPNINIYGHPVGGHPNVPTTVFQGNPESATAIYSANPSTTIRVQDIKFVDYPIFGIQVVRGDLYTVNVHYENCAGGTRLTNGALDVKGGILTNVGYNPYTGAPAYSGIVSFMANRHSIGSQHGTLDDGPWFFGGYRGVLVQETATGHVDYCRFEDLEIAVTSNRSSSVNPDGSSFKRNGIDLRAINASSIITGNRVDFGTGADASDQNMYADATSIISTGLHWNGIGTQNAISERLHTENSTTQVLTSSSTALVRQTLTPQGFNDLVAPNSAPVKAIVIRVTGEITQAAGRKRFAFAVGSGAASITINGGISGPFTVEAETIFRNQEDQVLRITGMVSGQPVFMRTVRASVDVSTSPQLVLNLLHLDGSGETTVHSVQTWMRGL